MKHLFVIVETPDGIKTKHQIEWKENETIQKSLNRFKKKIGRKNRICDWEAY